MTQHYELPDSFVRTNLEQRGEGGPGWLKRLPSILANCEQRWSLTLGPPFRGLSYNYAAPARRADGTTLVAKICYPGKEFSTELEALRIMGGNGAVQLLDFDTPGGIMLLEHIKPGTMLSTIEDDVEATSIAASVMRQIWRPAPEAHIFPTVADWADGMVELREQFEGGTGPFPPMLVEEAERLFSDLLSSMGDPVVLHGDLHHFNILAAEREPWLAIDPKGVVGEACYEVGALLRNPIPAIRTTPNLEQMLARRMDQLSDELGFDRQRVRGWAVAQAVLSAWWFIEDSDGLQNDSLKTSIAFAETIARVK